MWPRPYQGLLAAQHIPGIVTAVTCSSEKETRSALSSLPPPEPPPQGCRSKDPCFYLPAPSTSSLCTAGTWRLLHLGRWVPVASVLIKVGATQSCRRPSLAPRASPQWLKSTVSQPGAKQGVLSHL